jgi:hypothetical protein
VLYLFDANVLITASNTYYPIDRLLGGICG